MQINKTSFLNILSILGIFAMSHSQNIPGGSNQLDFIRESLRLTNSGNKASDAIGSPYIFEDFKVVVIKGYEQQSLLGRFNAYNGQMEIKTGDDIIALNEKNDYEIIFKNENVVYKTFKFTNSDGNDTNGFLLVLNEKDNFTFLKQERIKFYEGIAARTPYDTERKARFKRESDMYYFKIGDVLTSLPTSKRDLYKAFPDNEKEIKTFLKSSKISLNDEEDLSKLIDFLSTL
jgi:hypothetical protein